ncbi:bifunctional SulP family inorganic anion transporter/carbonic anhydrase [Nocardiopsis sp. EMB25]|uniref:bifunctional SulP family inorganic anion transporter/carbonic anhydrase n=1 Tax=Nocardiopsis sp. EMB25 TaxID=2835867 RepID=UPI0022852ED1|nr:bifunctional SulP family inorganic anion transporter/carbonic anhydrase [Nocardiopsis sp. EMB25]MCY9784516.1 bifunctional SulP family inorganic anion transporter/carbonic anhydrase [Nocardiopsis sp. EMB25]
MRTDTQGTPTASPPPTASPRRLPDRRAVMADVGASLVVFLVAVPLSLGIAVAAGAPLIAGLTAAIVGGIVAGLFGGSMVQVSGPTAAQTIIVAELITTYGWRVTCLITVLAGLLQVALGAVRIARAALAVSPAVIHGMLAGVGATIALAQLHVALGGAPQSSALSNITDLPHQVAHNHTAAVAVGVITIAIMFGWGKLPSIGRIRPSVVPASLVAVGTATAIATLGRWEVQTVSLPDSLVDAWSGPALPEAGQWHGVAMAVAAVAMVASVESLLSAIAVDREHGGRRVRLNRELFGQGAANTVSGALGGLPVAGVIVRSTTNVRAGGRTPLSAVLHGVWILVFVALFARVVELIPMAALAALLVFVGARMVSIAHLRDLRRHHEGSVYLVTLFGVVFLGLLEGVFLGFALAMIVSLRRLTRFTVRTEEHGGRVHVSVHGSLTFLGVPRLAHVLRTIPSGARVDLDLHVDFMDHAAFESIHAWRVDHERGGGSVDIDETHEQWYTRSSARTAPAAKTSPHGPGRWWAPWEMRGEADGEVNALGLLTAGAREYHASTADRMRSVMSRLAHGQYPTALFVTCADSRVVPNVITSSGPGDLFTLRNVGNLVPPSGTSGDGSVGAAVEYAVTVLGVPSIVVCGHSHCGAMKALLEGAHTDAEEAGTTHMCRWLANAAPSLARIDVPESPPESTPTSETLCRLARANVEEQLGNLMSYQVVRERVESGTLTLTGMYYDLETARVHLLDAETGRFSPVRGLQDVTGPVPPPRTGGGQLIDESSSGASSRPSC